MDANFFKANRHHLVEKLQGGSVVLTNYTNVQRSADMAHTFESESNFWWLSGIEAADWWLIIDGVRGRSTLVAPKISDIHAVFDGSVSASDARLMSGADAVVNQDEGEKLLQQMSRTHSLIYTIGDDPHADFYNFSINPAGKKMHDLLSRTFTSVQDCRKDIASLRCIKQPVEMKAMRKAIDLTCSVFDDIRQRRNEFSHEYEIEAEFSYQFRRRGARGHAYDPIVAAGQNACTLHYAHNNSKLKKHQLVLMDVGARVDGYAADITRTYAHGEPTKRQLLVHSAVQKAHHQIIALLEPGLSLQDYNQSVDKIMKEALKSLGLLINSNDEDAYRRYFPHAVSHGLGVDVHDSLGAPRYLEAGMVLTVEPGIYIPEEVIGVRIEDNILITKSGNENLSQALSTDLT